MPDLVRYAFDDHAVAFVTPDSPRTRNALSDKLLDDLLSALADARNVDRMKANELMMIGELIDAREAARLNIVNAVVPAAEFDTVVRAWAHKVAAKSPLLMRMGKDAINATRDLSLPDALSALRSQL